MASSMLGMPILTLPALIPSDTNPAIAFKIPGLLIIPKASGLLSAKFLIIFVDIRVESA